ncbi:histone deacetylase complex subunit SAP130-A-like isoform X2 [Dreissena polymorpha]|nr:histone deacetylase complex subunit SAP130-A-like isoform X2 [Dreissena polymorpha]
MSLNKPNFPTTGQGANFPTTGQGDRRVEEASKDLLRIPKGVHIAATGSISQAAHGYQVPRTLTKLAPAVSQGLAGLANKPVHQIANLGQALHKKVTEIQKVPLTLSSTSGTNSAQAAGGLSNIIPVQLSAPSATTNMRAGAVLSGVGHHPIPTQFQHSATGVVRTGSTLNVQRAQLHSGIQTSALNLQAGQMRSVRPGLMRAATPTTNRPASPAIGIGQTVEPHRVPLHNITTTVGSSPSIQITLQASRNPSDSVGKTTTTFQPGKVAMNQAVNLTCQPKVVLTHSLTPMLQHTTLAAKGNRGQPMNTLSSATMAASVATVTIPSMSAGTTVATIPIAKVPPQRQHQVVTSHVLASPTPAVTSSHMDHRVDPLPHGSAVSHPQPQPAHSHATTVAQQSTPQGGPGQPGLFNLQYRTGNLPVTTVASNSLSHTEARTSSLAAVPFLPPVLQMSPENPYYQMMMKSGLAAVAQLHGRTTLQSLGREAANSLQASLNSVSQSPLTVATAVGSAGSVRYNQMMVVPDAIRHAAPHTTGGLTAAIQLQPSHAEVKQSTTVTTAPMLPHTSAAASSLFAAVAAHQSQGQVSQIGHPSPNTPSSTPVQNPNSSPRPSILRKRTNEGISAVKKQLAMSGGDVPSPRPELRLDSTPVSNMSSPKTPASGESQSSTDTALSSEATTPTQPSHGELKIKHEHDVHENGYTNSTPEASPRKRRKQVLQATEEIRDTPVNVFDKLVEACVKQEVLDKHEAQHEVGEDDLDSEDEDDDDDDDFDDDQMDLREEYVDDDGVRWTLEKCRPNIALLNFYSISWKPKVNHFNRYTDVKPKDERRPTVNELSNQKGVVQKTSGWKLYHMAAQIEDLVELEKELKSTLQSLQAAIGPESPIRHNSLVEEESGVIHELTQGNIQRCSLLTDQLNEAKTQMLKVLEHKPKISEIVSKHMSKRPIKKKERT